VFTIAIDLIDLRGLRAIRQESPGEYALAATTAAMVVLVGVEQGIVLAMVLSLLRIVRHTYRPHTAVLVRGQKEEWRYIPAVPGSVTEPGLVIYRFGAPLFYANAHHFAEDVLNLVGPAPSAVHWLIVDAAPVTHVDYTAARAVLRLHQNLARRGTALVFARVPSELREDLDRHHLTEVIGAALLFNSLHEALAVIHENHL
jgi:MFS superfamily sulfate permease-like transporter